VRVYERGKRRFPRTPDDLAGLLPHEHPRELEARWATNPDNPDNPTDLLRRGNMNIPSVKTIKQRLPWLDKLDRLDPDVAARAVREAMEWDKRHQGNFCLAALKRMNDVLETFGVEYIQSSQDTQYGSEGLSYLNTGGPYVPTVIYDHGKGKWIIGAWGDIVEREPRRFASAAYAAYFGVAAPGESRYEPKRFHWTLMARGNDIEKLLDKLQSRVRGPNTRGDVIALGEGGTLLSRTEAYYPDGMTGAELVKLLHGRIVGSIGGSLANSNPAWGEAERRFEEIVSDLTDRAFALMMNWPYEVWVYHQPSTASEYGEFYLVTTEPPPEGASLSWQERLPRSLSRDQLRAWIHQRARRLPLLPHGRDNPQSLQNDEPPEFPESGTYSRGSDYRCRFCGGVYEGGDFGGVRISPRHGEDYVTYMCPDCEQGQRRGAIAEGRWHNNPAPFKLLRRIGNDDFLSAYFECALWSSTDDEGEPLDDTYGLGDIDEASLASMAANADSFLNHPGVRDAIDAAGGDYSQAGHDFWLTRNGHGAGFWDGDWPEPQATLLTQVSETYGEVDLYVGDDGVVYATE
jgi:hypothetical protein